MYDFMNIKLTFLYIRETIDVPRPLGLWVFLLKTVDAERKT